MPESIDYQIYRDVVHKALLDEERLPSLPAITMKIRSALADPDISHRELAKLISRDPSLASLIIKYANSPAHHTAVPPKGLSEAIAQLGFKVVSNLTMMHSVESLFTMRKPQLKKLFQIAWERQLFKAGLSEFFAQKLHYQPADEPFLASLLTEIGTLAILSAFEKGSDIPNSATYIKLCREYSKPLSILLLTKWRIPKTYIDLIKHSGDWSYQNSSTLELHDIVNLALYNTIHYTTPNANLPPLKQVSSYKKLPPQLRHSNDDQHLMLVEKHRKEIYAIASCLR